MQWLMKVRLAHTAEMCWEIPDSCTIVTKFMVKTGYARTYHKGAWAAPNDRGAVINNKNFIKEDEIMAITAVFMKTHMLYQERKRQRKRKQKKQRLHRKMPKQQRVAAMRNI